MRGDPAATNAVGPAQAGGADPRLRRIVTLVAAANLIYFFVEFAVARRIESVSLFADSIDFLEDASVNALIALGLGWGPRRRGRLGMALAGLLLVPTTATVWSAWRKSMSPSAPDAWLLSNTGLGALAVNLGCAFALGRAARAEGSLARAAFLSARNDALANVAIVVAGIATARWASGWPDFAVGLGIAALNLGAAREVWVTARREHAAVRS